MPWAILLVKRTEHTFGYVSREAMEGTMILFRKTIPVEGYEWRHDLVLAKLLNPEGTVANGPFLVGKGSRGRVESPLEAEEIMFEAFADLAKVDAEELPKRIQRFANSFGDLGRHLLLIRPNVETSPTWAGEDLALWRSEIQDLALVFTIWYGVKEHDIPLLKQLVHRIGTGVAVTWNEHHDVQGLEDLVGKGKYAAYNDLDLQFLDDDWIGPANYILQKLINEKVTGHVSPRLIRDELLNLQSDLVPDSLLSAIWLQMFNAVAGIDEYILCEVCGGLIKRNPGSRSSKRVHTRCAKNRYLQKKMGEGD
jgi:hypothetical protein